jgi:hypothetical protein
MKPSILVVAALVIVSTSLLAFKFTEPEKTLHTVEYKVMCNSCEVTYRDESGNSKDIEAVSNTWSYKFKGERGQFIYVSALDSKGEPVKVIILKDEQEFATDESKATNISARAGTIL